MQIIHPMVDLPEDAFGLGRAYGVFSEPLSRNNHRMKETGTCVVVNETWAGLGGWTAAGTSPTLQDFGDRTVGVETCQICASTP